MCFFLIFRYRNVILRKIKDIETLKTENHTPIMNKIELLAGFSGIGTEIS